MKNQMKLSLISILATLAIGSAAFANQRVIVVMKDTQSFKIAQQAYLTQNSIMWKSAQFDEPTLAHVEDSLEHLNTFVVMAKDAKEIASLKNNPDVQLVEEDIIHPLPKMVVSQFGKKLSQTLNPGLVSVPGASTPWGVLAVKAPQAWEVSRQGQGARVLVLDTGIDKDHPSLAGNFEQGKDFTGRSKGEDFADLVGHGSHVSGTIAGVMDDSGFTGVAPKAKLLMGRVCSNLGCSTSAIVKGVNWGIAQKVDLISMSLGGGFMTAGEQDAFKKADAAGVTIVAASGNDGTDKVAFPAALPTAIAVGAVDINHKKADFSQYGPELAVMAPGVDVMSTVPRGTGRSGEALLDEGAGAVKVNCSAFSGVREVLNAETASLVPAGFGKKEDFAGKDFKGKFALVSRGEIYFAEKVKNAALAGATGLIAYNNAPGLISGALSAEGTVSPVAVFMIEQEVGQRILAKIQAGQDIKITVHTLVSDFMPFQGTSMATPHVAGVVALMKAANQNLSPAQVKSILRSTSEALGPNDKNQYGAGLVNAEAAVNAALQTH